MRKIHTRNTTAEATNKNIYYAMDLATSIFFYVSSISWTQRYNWRTCVALCRSYSMDNGKTNTEKDYGAFLTHVSFWQIAIILRHNLYNLPI